MIISSILTLIQLDSRAEEPQMRETNHVPSTDCTTRELVLVASVTQLRQRDTSIISLMNFHPSIHLSIHVMRGDCISRFFQRLSPLLAQHMGMFSGAPSTRFALNGRQQKSHQLRRSQVKAWSRHFGWWLFSSPVAQLLDLSKQKKLRKEKLKIEHHQRMRKVQRLIGAWERVVWKRGVWSKLPRIVLAQPGNL